MFPLDVDTRRMLYRDRTEALRASYSSVRGSRIARLGRRARLRLPFAAPELEAAPRALPSPVHPVHVGPTAPARLDSRHGTNLRGPADAPCYTRSAGRRSSVG